MHIVIISSFILVLACIGCNLAPGSYPYAEIYKLNTEESKLISAVEESKVSNPEFNVPYTVGLIDGQSTNITDHWFHIYFYNKDDDEIIYTWVHQINKNEVSFALVSFNKGLKPGNWKRINKGYQNIENKQRIKKFECLILDKIKEKL